MIRPISSRETLLEAEVRDDLRKQVNDAGERIFRAMMVRGDVCFRLEASGDPDLNWELAKTFELDVTNEVLVQLRSNGQPLERSLFDRVYQKQLNGLEKDVALILDVDKAVKWWHKIAVFQDWHLQGWQRSRVYPDFLICLHEQGDGIVRFSVLETKGLHLKGNEDTEYKRKLLQPLAIVTGPSLIPVQPAAAAMNCESANRATRENRLGAGTTAGLNQFGPLDSPPAAGCDLEFTCPAYDAARDIVDRFLALTWDIPLATHPHRGIGNAPLAPPTRSAQKSPPRCSPGHSAVCRATGSPQPLGGCARGPGELVSG